MLREVLTLAGAGLLLLAPSHPARQRLTWLAGSRWPQPGSRPEPESRSGPGSHPAALMTRSSVVSGVFRHRVAAGAILAGTLTGLVTGPVPGGLLVLLMLAGDRGWRRLSAERAAAADEAGLVDLVAALAAEHSAGANIPAALRECAAGARRWQPELSRAARLAAHGDEPAQGLTSDPALIPLAVAISLAGRTGAALTGVLARLQADLAAAQQTRRATAEAMAGPRSSALLLAVLPGVGLAMGTALGAHPWSILTRTPAGLAGLAAGVLLELAGLAWTLRLTR